MLIREEAHTSAGTRACTLSGVSSLPNRRLAAPYIQRMLHFASWRSNGLILGMKTSWRKHTLFGLYREGVRFGRDRKKRSVAKPKTKIHHGGTETRRRSKPIFTAEDTEGHGGGSKQ